MEGGGLALSWGKYMAYLASLPPLHRDRVKEERDMPSHIKFRCEIIDEIEFISHFFHI